MKPLFSVVIPTLNEEKFIGKLLDDLTKQTFFDFEVLVIDAYSEDKTVQEVKKFKSSDFRLKVVQIDKRSAAIQRNTGARLSKGSYLIFLDADSRINATFIKKLTNQIAKKSGVLFLPSISCIEKDIQVRVALDFWNAFVALSNKIGKPFSSGGSMIVERFLFNHIGGFPEDVHICEDHLLVQTAYRYGIHACFLPSIKIKVSLRRLNREGKLNVFFKYIKSTLYFFTQGKIDKKIIEYEMGGHLYNKQSKKVFKDLIKLNPHSLLKNFNKNIQAFLRTLDI